MTAVGKGQLRGAPGKPVNADQMEITRLKAELSHKRMERDILKKAAANFCEGVAVRYAFIERHRTVWPIVVQCRVLDVSVSGYRQYHKRQMKRSMSPKGDCWDNAVTGTLFGSLKVERLYGMRFTTWRSAKHEVMDWLTFYNSKWLHSTLGYTSPMAFEKKRLAQKTKLVA